MPQEKLIPYYQKAKVYCQLSMREGLPNALCEALLVGLVVFFLAGMGPSSIIAFSPTWIFFAFALGFLNYYKLKQTKESNL